MVWVILGMGVGVYGLRLVGLALRDVALPPLWDRALRFVPVAFRPDSERRVVETALTLLNELK